MLEAHCVGVHGAVSTKAIAEESFHRKRNQQALPAGSQVTGFFGKLRGRAAEAQPSASTATDPSPAHEEGQRSESSHTREQDMELGAFSISLAAKDLEASRKFYEMFGFKVFGGDPS